MSIVHASRGHFEPIRKEVQSEISIIANIAKRSLVNNTQLDWQAFVDNYELIRNSLADCLIDFADYNRRLNNKDGFLLTNPASLRIFFTHNKKAQFTAAKHLLTVNQDYDLLLTTIRSHDQFNTAIYGLNDRYRNIKGERRVVFMNDIDMAKFYLKANDLIDLISTDQYAQRIAYGFAVKNHAIKEGCAAAYFPEANVLVPLNSVALKSNTPTSKLIPIKIRKSVS